MPFRLIIPAGIGEGMTTCSYSLERLLEVGADLGDFPNVAERMRPHDMFQVVNDDGNMSAIVIRLNDGVIPTVT